MKRAVLILSIVAMLLLIVGTFMFFGSVASAASQCAQITDPAAQQQCAQQAGTQQAGSIALGFLVLGLGGLATTIAWVLGLIKTAQVKAWGWFVAVLLVSPLGSLIYGIAGPDSPPAPPSYAPQGYAAPGYPPNR
jgi:hypothetical protein